MPHNGFMCWAMCRFIASFFIRGPERRRKADLLCLVDSDTLCELIDGTLVAKPMGWQESIIATNITAKLGAYIEQTNAGVVSGADRTLRMASSGRVRLPDVSYFSMERFPKSKQPIPTLAPDLAVEVLSESNTKSEIDQKLREFFDSGTRLVWIVDLPSRSVTVYHRGIRQPGFCMTRTLLTVNPSYRDFPFWWLKSSGTCRTID